MILSIHIAAGGLAMILGAVALAVKRAGLPIGAVGCCLSMSSSSWVPVPPFWRFEKVQATDLDADTLPHHMDDGDARPKERPEQNDDVPRSPFGEHERSVQPDHPDEHRTAAWERSRCHPADDVVRQVKRREEDREQRRDS